MRRQHNAPPKVHTHTHTFNGPLSGTTRVSQYQKGKTDFTEARDSEWQWHQLGHMQVTLLQTDNCASVFLQAGCPSTQPTASKHWRQIYDKYLIIKHRRFSVTVKLIFPHKNKCLVYDAIQQTNKYSPEASNQPPALRVYQYHHDQWLLGSTIIHNKTQRITENTEQCNITQQTTATTTTTPV